MIVRVTSDMFHEVFPRAKLYWVDVINEHLDHYFINNPSRLCVFLAQCGHETALFTTFSENLNYSARALLQVFSKYFPDEETAEAYARRPEKIACKVYANRMGNGDEQSGDGWKYRGRGLIQLTGKTNYQAFADAVGHPEVVADPDIVLEPDMAVRSALWFWDIHKLNILADAHDMKRITKVINGGLNGYDDRCFLFRKLMDYYV